VPEPDSTTPAPSDDDDRRFTQRIQAEIAADAERRRREDPELARVEREIERAWAHVAPPGAAGPTEELLLDRIDRLSMVDVDAPLGSRAGVRQVKGMIRKGTYWYLRYLGDQLNALHNVQARLLRRMDERLARIESTVGLERSLGELVEPASAPGRAVGEIVVAAIGSSPGVVMVASCGAGDCVASLVAGAVSAYGVDADPEAVLGGIDAGLDLRVADPAEHLDGLEPGSLAGVVIGGALQRGTVSGVVAVARSAAAACRSGGVVIVAPEALAERSTVDAELLAGRGVSAQAWARVLQATGATTELRPVDQVGLDAVVIARLP
jgi:hypothetical protein